MIRSDFHEIEQPLRDRISHLTRALNDIASSEPIPTPFEGWQFCRDVARVALAALSDAVAENAWPEGADCRSPRPERQT